MGPSASDRTETYWCGPLLLRTLFRFLNVWFYPSCWVTFTLARHPKEPYLIEGDLGVDDRGEVAFVNGFRFEGVKRFYLVSNHRAGFVRAWHAHRRETKYVTVVQGAALVAAVAIDNWEHPSKNAKLHRYVLAAQKPAVVCIPPGYANGFMSLTQDAKLIFFSTSTLEESREDDVRYDARYWDAWTVVER